PDAGDDGVDRRMGRVRMEVWPLDRALRARAAGRSRLARIPGARAAWARRLSSLGTRYARLRTLLVLPAGPARRLGALVGLLQRFGNLQPLRFETRQLPGELALAGEACLQRFTRIFRIGVARCEPCVERPLFGVQRVHFTLQRRLPREQRFACGRSACSRVGLRTLLRAALVGGA